MNSSPLNPNFNGEEFDPKALSELMGRCFEGRREAKRVILKTPDGVKQALAKHDAQHTQ